MDDLNENPVYDYDEKNLSTDHEAAFNSNENCFINEEAFYSDSITLMEPGLSITDSKSDLSCYEEVKGDADGSSSRSRGEEVICREEDRETIQHDLDLALSQKLYLFKLKQEIEEMEEKEKLLKSLKKVVQAPKGSPLSTVGAFDAVKWEQGLEIIFQGYGARFEMPELSHDSRLGVPKSLTFELIDKENENGGWFASLILSNLTDVNMTYSIQASSDDMSIFKIDQNNAWIMPNSKHEVIISSTASLSDISSSFFAIFAQPLYFELQLNIDSLDKYWNEVGTELNPLDQIEMHGIDEVYFNVLDLETTSLPLIEKVAFGFPLRNKRRVKVPKFIEFNEISTFSALRFWGFTLEQNRIYSRMRAKESHRYMLRLREKREKRASESKLIFIGVSTITGLSMFSAWYAEYLQFYPPSLGILGFDGKLLIGPRTDFLMKLNFGDNTALAVAHNTKDNYQAHCKAISVVLDSYNGITELIEEAYLYILEWINYIIASFK